MSTEDPQAGPGGRWEQPTRVEPSGQEDRPGPPTADGPAGGWPQAPSAPAAPPPQPPYTYGPPPLWGYSPPPPYGPPPMTMAPQPQTEGMAIAVLVLAVASFFIFGPGVIMAIVALALCPSARRNIESSGGALTGEGLVTAARIIAWVNVGLIALMVVAFVVFFILVAAFSEPDEFDSVMALASLS